MSGISSLNGFSKVIIIATLRTFIDTKKFKIKDH